MLRGNPGKRLINRSVERALHFRKEVQRLREESDGWFFDIWQPPQVDEANAGPLRLANSGTALTMRMPIICFSIRLKSLF